MIIPCIDLLDGKVVQLVQGRRKELEGDAPDVMRQRFSAFPVLQVIDLDAAMGTGQNSGIVAQLANSARIRAGGGVRTVQRARELAALGVDRVIVGTAAFTSEGLHTNFLEELRTAIGRDRLQIALDTFEGRIVIKGWQQSVNASAEQLIAQLEPYCSSVLCTYVDKEGMLQGTDLGWFERLRNATSLEITAAGGITTMDEVRRLIDLRIDVALGMAIYKGVLDLAELAALQSTLGSTAPTSQD